MSYRESLRKISREDVEAHAQNIIASLKAEPAYAEVCRRAEEMGYSVVLSLCDTYTPEKASVYLRPEDRETIPAGYCAQLRADLVRDGFILFIGNEDGTYDQLTTGETIIDSPETLFVPKLTFYEYDDLPIAQEFPDYLEEYLDRLEDDGAGKTSLFRIDDPLAQGVVVPDVRPAALSELTEQEHAVELLPGAFEGVYLNDTSLFFDEKAFLPFATVLEALHFGFYVPHGVSVLEGELLDGFCEALERLVAAIDHAPDFFSAMTEAELYSVEPSESEKQRLNELVFQDRDEFCETCHTLTDWLKEHAEQSGCVSVLWP